MPQPYAIKIFLPDGDRDGLRTIEKSNWSGAGILFPRALLGMAKSRRELSPTGVYVLVGSSKHTAKSNSVSAGMRGCRVPEI